MNVDVFAVSIIACFIGLFILYIVNLRADFTNAKSDCVYNFDYVQPVTGARERFLAKVISNEKWTSEQIRGLNFRSDYRSGDKNFEREGNLVTCIMPNGEHRRFWSGRVVNCKPVLAGGLMYRFASFI